MSDNVRHWTDDIYAAIGHLKARQQARKQGLNKKAGLQGLNTNTTGSGMSLMQCFYDLSALIPNQLLRLRLYCGKNECSLLK